MGPGYMPMLVFWILMGLGIIVLGTAFFNGPDPMEKWTGHRQRRARARIVAGYGAFLVAPHVQQLLRDQLRQPRASACWSASW